MSEAQLELTFVRCPRCGGEVVLRVAAEERGRAVELTLDRACVVCGASPGDSAEQRTVVFDPGAPLAVADDSVQLEAAQARIDALARRCQSLESELAAARRDLSRSAADERRRRGDREESLRAEISRLEAALASARAEARHAEDATRADVEPGKRAIEID